jgi:nicotinamide mononucleotide transporter
MLLLQIFEALHSNLLETTSLEFIAVFFGLLSVWFARQEKILVYPTGIISVVIYVYICFEVQLFADAGINFFYFIMSIYGWYMWSKKRTSQPLKITASSFHEWIYSAGLFIFSWVVIFLLLMLFNNDETAYWSSAVPYIDVTTTSVFIVAMWLMALKKIEHWILWIIGNVISVPLYAYKGLVLTSFQFLVFLALAIAGYITWRKKLRSNSL